MKRNSLIIKNIFNDRDVIRANRSLRRLNENELHLKEDMKVEELLDEFDETDDEIEELSKMFDADDDNTLVEDSLFEEDTDTDSVTEAPAADENNMTDEELKDESLKIAINVAKLMTNVQANDIITIAGTIADFIRNHEIGKGDLDNLAPDTDSVSDDEDEEMDEMDGISFFDDESSDVEDTTVEVDSDEDIPENDENPFEEE